MPCNMFTCQTSSICMRAPHLGFGEPFQRAIFFHVRCCGPHRPSGSPAEFLAQICVEAAEALYIFCDFFFVFLSCVVSHALPSCRRPWDRLPGFGRAVLDRVPGSRRHLLSARTARSSFCSAGWSGQIVLVNANLQAKHVLFT